MYKYGGSIPICTNVCMDVHTYKYVAYLYVQMYVCIDVRTYVQVHNIPICTYICICNIYVRLCTVQLLVANTPTV